MIKLAVTLPQKLAASVRPHEAWLIVDMVTHRIIQSDVDPMSAQRSADILRRHDTRVGHNSDYHAVHRDDCIITPE